MVVGWVSLSRIFMKQRRSETHCWKFAEEFDVARREALSSIDCFPAVVELVVNSLCQVHLKPCRGRESSLEACVQPVFSLSLSDQAFDAFFNSPHGYRGQFLSSPNLGLAANLALIEALLPALLLHASRVRVAELESIDLRASLQAASCKVWVHEDDFPFQSLTQDLAVEPWIREAAQGEKKALWGLCAPSHARIEVKGALLDPAGNEVVPRTKIARRYEIQRFGFT